MPTDPTPITAAELRKMTEPEQINATEGLPEHPDDWDGPCMCDDCIRANFDGADEDTPDAH